MVIDTYSYRSIFLFHKKNRCTKRAARGANVSSVEVFVDLVVWSRGVHFRIGDRVCEGEFCGWESDRWDDASDQME